MSFVLGFFPNLVLLRHYDHIYKKKEERFVVDCLKMNPKFTVKTENHKFHQFLKDLSQHNGNEACQEAKQIYY